MGVMEQDLKGERQQWQDLFLQIRKLPEKKQQRVFNMIDTLQEAESLEEAVEIAAGIAEVMAKAHGSWPKGSTTDWEQGVTDETKTTVAAYHHRTGDAIRKRREQLKMTQEQLATKAGLPQSHISRLEVGKHAPTRSTIEKIAAALDTTPGLLDLLYD